MSSDIFRDRTEGASARRQDLLRRRRDEFVTMPHAIRRVYVARGARIAASVAVLFAGAGFIATALSPSLAAWLSRGMPGLNPAVLSTFVFGMWAIAALAYFLSRSRGEHRFAVEMSRYVLPGSDLDHDLERLSHEHPDEIARTMAHRLEVKSAALPIAAAAMLVPVTALYFLHGVRNGGWPTIADFEASIGAHASILAVCAIAGLVIAIVMTRRTARLPAVAPIAGVLAVAGLAAAKWTTWWLAVVGGAAAAVALIVWRLRRERALLETEDPAAGSELFTLRGFIKQVRSTTSAIASRTLSGLRASSPRQRLLLVAAVAMIAGGVFAITGSDKQKKQAHAAVPAIAMAKPSVPVVLPSGSKYSVEPTGDGRLRIEVTLADDDALDIAFPGLDHVPLSWMARIQIEAETFAGPVQVTIPGEPSLAARTLGFDRSRTTFSSSTCGDDRHALGLRVQSEVPGRYVLLVAPVLEPAGC